MEAVSGESNPRFCPEKFRAGRSFSSDDFLFFFLEIVSFLWKTIVFCREKSFFPINFFTLIFLFVIFVDL